MATTFDPIATTTLGSAAATITFSSISSAYTDLRLVMVGTNSSASGYIGIRFNNDSAGNYSYTQLTGTGSVSRSTSNTNDTQIYLGSDGTASTTSIPGMKTIDIFSYAGSTYKTILNTNAADLNGSGTVVCEVGLWRSTSAINRVDLMLYSGNFNTGFTATLYGILKA